MTYDRAGASKLRERLREQTLARRNTPEWAAAGAALTNRRAEADAARREELKRARELERQRRRDEAPVTDDELRRAVDQCEASIREAALDSGLEEDVVAYDVVTGQCLSFRTKLAAEVKRVMLGIEPDDELPADYVAKLIGY